MGETQKTASKILHENKKSIVEIAKKVRSVKKKVEQMPSYPTARTVDLPFDMLSRCVSFLERMRETYERDDGTRHRIYE